MSVKRNRVLVWTRSLAFVATSVTKESAAGLTMQALKACLNETSRGERRTPPPWALDRYRIHRQSPLHDHQWARRGCSVITDLRQVAAPPWEEDLLVTARPKGVVDVWSLMRGARCATFETIWGSGGWRGALVPGEHPVVVAGAWGAPRRMRV